MSQTRVYTTDPGVYYKPGCALQTKVCTTDEGVYGTSIRIYVCYRPAWHLRLLTVVSSVHKRSGENTKCLVFSDGIKVQDMKKSRNHFHLWASFQEIG